MPTAWVFVRSLDGVVASNTGGGMDVSCEGFVLSGRCLCIGPITRPEQSYRLWCIQWV